MDINNILNAVYDQSVGWRPATGALKPAHIANGLFRGLVGETYNVMPATDFIIPWTGKSDAGKEVRKSYETMVLDKDHPCFRSFQDEHGKERFERLREFTRGVLNADGAVYPSRDMQSFSISCRQLISGDKMDREVGRFMSDLLRGGNGRLAKVVTECLANDVPQDPITLLAWPLLRHDAEPIEKRSKKISPYSNTKLSGFFKQLEVAADTLADYQQQLGNRLATLQKAVQFSCISLLAHAQALSVNGALEERSPMLLTIDAMKGSRIANASEESLVRLYESFADWLAHRLAERLQKGQPVDLGGGKGEEEYLTLPASLRRDTARKFLADIGVDRKTAEPDDIDGRMTFFEQALARHGKENPSIVFGETLVQCYMREYKHGPKQFLEGVGRKVGFIYPNFQGRSLAKRVQPSVAILDMFVQACTPHGESIRLNEFLDLLWKRFGIVVGGRNVEKSSDHELLAGRNINISQSDLEENTRKFVDYLVDIGLARRYPDNIAYVGRQYA